MNHSRASHWIGVAHSLDKEFAGRATAHDVQGARYHPLPEAEQIKFSGEIYCAIDTYRRAAGWPKRWAFIDLKRPAAPAPATFRLQLRCEAATKRRFSRYLRNIELRQQNPSLNSSLSPGLRKQGRLTPARGQAFRRRRSNRSIKRSPFRTTRFNKALHSTGHGRNKVADFRGKVCSMAKK